MADFKGTIGTVPEELRGSLSSDLSLSGRLSSLGIPGNGIASIEKTSTDGLTDTYTITYDDGTTTTYQITNGNGIFGAVFNDDNTLTLSFDDGTELTTGVLRGDDGEKVLLKAENNVVSYAYESDPNWTTLVDLTGFADDASNAADRANAKAEEARQSAIRAENSASDANANAGIATTKAEEAASSEEQAGISMRRAETAASDALASKNLAQEAAATAITAQDNSRIYSERTLGYANNAAQSAQSASNSAASAAQSATGLSEAVASAQQSAREAASSATQAQEYYDGIDEVAVQAMEDYLDAHLAVQSVNGKTRNVVLNAEDVGALPEDTFIPSKISDLTDDSGHYTKPATGIPASDLADGVIPDVQIDGTSIVEDGVANIPQVTAWNEVGVVKIVQYRGLGFEASTGALTTVPANQNHIKSGVTGYAPIIPLTQHMSTFYGLAKAAGHDEKDSTLPVGTYTDEAKAAIKSMLGVPEDPLAVGTALPASADLDTYTTPGTYSADSTVMASVTNAPTVTVPYKLVIESIGDTAIEQTVTTTDNQVYHRSGDLSGSNVAFGDWVKDVINTDCATDMTGKAIAEVIDDFTTCLATLTKRGDLFGGNKFIHGENDELILQYPSDNIEATVTLMTDTTGSLISQELQRMASIWEEAYNAN